MFKITSFESEWLETTPIPKIVTAIPKCARFIPKELKKSFPLLKLLNAERKTPAKIRLNMIIPARLNKLRSLKIK